jgi:hypothetical protein
MAEVEVKCPHCGFAAVKKIGPMSNVEFSYPKDVYTICPIITDRLDRGEPGVNPIDCPHFRQAAAGVAPPPSS